MVATKKAAKATAGKPKKLVFTVDCRVAADDNIIDTAGLEKYFHDRLKIEGQVGNFRDRVKINREKSKVTVVSEVHLSKRYLKFLTRKYLKKQQLHDFLRVIASNKQTYELRYFNIQGNEEAEE